MEIECKWEMRGPIQTRPAMAWAQANQPTNRYHALNMTHVLCLDIDGVLHPSDCRVLLDFHSPGWLLAAQARTQGLFRWSALLNEALHGTDARLLLHSTWRRRCSDRVLQELLGPDLAPRVIVADYWVSPDDRIHLSHAAYIEQVLRAWQENGGGMDNRCHDAREGGQEALCLSVLDDRPNLFRDDMDRLDAYAPAMIWTNPALGISEPSIQQRVSQWARTPRIGIETHECVAREGAGCPSPSP